MRRRFGRCFDGPDSIGKKSLPAVVIVVGLGLVGTGVLSGIQWLGEGAYWRVSQVEVQGTKRLTSTEVTRKLALGPNANMFATPMAELESRLMSHPWIQTAQVRRDFPNTLAVEVQEEVAVAAIMLGELYLLNKQGKPFKRAQGPELDGLSIVTGFQREAVARGQMQEELSHTLAALHNYQQIPGRLQIGEVHFDEQYGISLVTLEKAIGIHIGNPDSAAFAERFAAFDTAYHALDSEESAAVMAFHIADHSPVNRVTVAFSSH